MSGPRGSPTSCTRSTAVRTVQRSGRRSGSSSSSQWMDTDTGAPGAGRVLNGATSALLMAFWVYSRRASPCLRSFCHSQLIRSGTVRPTARETFSTHALVSSKVNPERMETQIWTPCLPVTLGIAATPRCSSATRYSRASTRTSLSCSGSRGRYGSGPRSAGARRGAGRPTGAVPLPRSSPSRRALQQCR
jgi:hypothetical protein